MMLSVSLPHASTGKKTQKANKQNPLTSWIICSEFWTEPSVLASVLVWSMKKKAGLAVLCLHMAPIEHQDFIA